MTMHCMPSDIRAIEDFKWCTQSPPLMLFEDDQCWPDEAWFQEWKLVPTTSLKLTEYKLGLRFEAVVAQWIELEPSLHLLAKNLVVHDGKRTIGEFDLILENNGTVEHWELAVKFYLGVGDVSYLDNWHGPDPTDTLARKINRMTSHQLRLSQHPAGQRLLQQHGWEVRRARSLVKGRLFHPYHSFRLQTLLMPPNVNPGHEQGWWITATDFALAPQLKNARFVILERSQWFAPLPSIGNNPVMDHHQAVSFLSDIETKGTIPIAQLTANGEELSRGFVVFPQWLKDAEAQKV